MDWITHEEDVWFKFEGSRPNQLTPGRYYKGTVDGFAEFGVFIDLAPGVTGLLHRSELDRRLDSLEWDPGDTVFVQVKNVRDNGNIDLGWSKRQSEEEFRGARVDDPEGDPEGEPLENETNGAESKGPVRTRPQSDGRTVATGAGESAGEDGDDRDESAAMQSETEAETGTEAENRSASADDADTGTEAAEPARAESDFERVEIAGLTERVGERVRIEGEIVGARQTGGPTVFELRDESGVVDCAAFVEAGVRAYPEIDIGDVVRLDGEVELRQDELQVETEDLEALDGEEREAVENRLTAALTDKARPDAVAPLADHDSVQAVADQLLDAAEAIRRAVFESRPIVVRHAATADGYVAGAAVERAVLPLIREEYAKSDAEYHYFVRRPLDEAVYGMDAATNDVTRMLQDRDRHDEKLPLVLLVGTGSTVESGDGLGLLGVYGARRVVVDAAVADPDVEEHLEVLVNPARAGSDASDLSTGALGANLAAAVNDDVRADLAHLPAVSYWEGTPEAYVDLADEVGFDAERVRELRQAVALEAYYQSYEDKRELITDILFEDSGAGGDARSLASHVSEQYRVKVETEVETAQANIDDREEAGVRFAVLDTDAYTHRFDFPPTSLLLDELHRRNREGDRFVTVGAAMDELYLRSTVPLDAREVAEAARERLPDAGITAVGVREGRIEFLAGARDEVINAVVEAVAEQVN